MRSRRRRRRRPSSAPDASSRRRAAWVAEPCEAVLPQPRPPPSLRPYRHAEASRRGAGIRPRLARARPDRPPVERAQLGLVPADADREVGWADAAALVLAHEPLDLAVLERVEADHREPAAGAEHLEGGGERVLELAQLVVDGNSQRLEDPLGRMPVAEARRRGDRGPDDLDELARPLDRPPAALASDRPRDLARVPLFAVALADLREVALAPFVDDLARRDRVARVHAHVERRVDGVREAALRPVELHRRHAEVEQDRVGPNAVVGELAEDIRCLAAMEPGGNACRSLEAVEVRLDGRV